MYLLLDQGHQSIVESCNTMLIVSLFSHKIMEIIKTIQFAALKAIPKIRFHCLNRIEDPTEKSDCP